MRRRGLFLLVIMAAALLAGASDAGEKYHLFFLEKPEGNLELFFNRDAANGYRPRNELFHYQVYYSGLLVGECLIKYRLEKEKFTAYFSSNTQVLPRRATVDINPDTLLPEKIVVEENLGGRREIIYNQTAPSVTSGREFKKMLHPIIEPITMACIFRNFDLARGQANFFFGEKGRLFSFDLARGEPLKNPSGAHNLRFVSQPPKITIILSDEVEKIPVGLVYDLFVGRLELRLIKYQKGN